MRFGNTGVWVSFTPNGLSASSIAAVIAAAAYLSLLRRRAR